MIPPALSRTHPGPTPVRGLFVFAAYDAPQKSPLGAPDPGIADGVRPGFTRRGQHRFCGAAIRAGAPSRTHSRCASPLDGALVWAVCRAARRRPPSRGPIPRRAPPCCRSWWRTAPPVRRGTRGRGPGRRACSRRSSCWRPLPRRTRNPPREARMGRSRVQNHTIPRTSSPREGVGGDIELERDAVGRRERDHIPLPPDHPQRA